MLWGELGGLCNLLMSGGSPHAAYFVLRISSLTSRKLLLSVMSGLAGT